MLVLSRKKNESIVINENITIVVVEVRGDKVRLGINAPKDVPVHRKEIFDAIQAAQVTSPVTLPVPFSCDPLPSSLGDLQGNTADTAATLPKE